MSKRLLAAASILLALGVAPAHAASIVFDNTNPVSIPGLTGFATGGDEMVGMEVTATFATGFSETLAWAATGVTSGGVTGTGWSLSVSGDTFTSLIWSFDFTADLQLTSLLLNGPTGLTVFDTTFGGADGTLGSEAGKTFISNHANDGSITATYSNPVGIGAAPPVGDLYHVLFIDFSQAGVRTDFLFSQDTDNDARLLNAVPEPGSLALLGLGLAGLARARRRRAR